MGSAGRDDAYRNELEAAHARIASLERAGAANDPSIAWLDALEKERARVLATGPTRMTRAQRALPNAVTVPFAAFALGAAMIGMWGTALLAVLAAIAIHAAVRAFAQRSEGSQRRAVAEIDARIADLRRLQAAVRQDEGRSR